MTKQKIIREKTWYQLFELGIVIKVINGFLQIIGGFLILFVNTSSPYRLFRKLTGDELLDDRPNKIIEYVANALQHFSTNTKLIIGLYVLLHGLLNIFLAINLQRNKLWAYVANIGFTLLFISYQLYTVGHGHAPGLLLVSAYDIFIIVVTWHRYQYQKKLLGIPL